jgi:hypothetical protein
MRRPTAPSKSPSSAADTEAYLVQPKDIDYVWDKVQGLIAEASFASRMKWLPEDAYKRLKAGKAQLWVAWGDDAIQACVLTEIHDGDRQKQARIVTCAGWNIRRWVDHVETIERWAKEQGCQAMYFNAHPVIARLLSRKGYEITHWTCEREL